MMESKEIEALSTIRRFAEKNVAVSFSGGKDSLVALDLAERAGIRKMIFVDTTIEFEETLEYLGIIRDLYSVKLEIVKAPIDFFKMIDYVGMPSRRFRWCCDVFKFGPLVNYAKKNRIEGFITGLRKEESNRRSNYKKIDRNPLVPYLQINPLLNWSEEEIWAYINKYDLPKNPLYEYFDRLGCWCCPFRTEKDWDQIEKHFPEKLGFLNSKLNLVAEKFNIRDKERYIARRGWTYWVFSPKRINISGISVLEPDDGKEARIYFYENDNIVIDKIIESNLFYAISDRVDSRNNVIIIKNRNFSKRKLISYVERVVEKTLNCVGCGACLFLCDSKALEVSEGSVHINELKCISCGKCLSTQPLRGGCVMRNYAPRRTSCVARD